MTKLVAGKMVYNAGEKPFCEMCKQKGKDVLMEALEFGPVHEPHKKKVWRCPECRHQVDIK